MKRVAWLLATALLLPACPTETPPDEGQGEGDPAPVPEEPPAEEPDAQAPAAPPPTPEEETDADPGEPSKAPKQAGTPAATTWFSVRTAVGESSTSA